jgi:hypothetical protein
MRDRKLRFAWTTFVTWRIDNNALNNVTIDVFQADTIKGSFIIDVLAFWGQSQSNKMSHDGERCQKFQENQI